MCVQRVDDSLNSAIHTTFSHFAAFFIVARTKRSIVERCILFDAFCTRHVGIQVLRGWCEKKKEFLLLAAVKQNEKQGKRHAIKRAHPLQVNSRLNSKRSKRGVKILCVLNVVEMILPQVHLRKPCYDFSFL